MDRHRPRRRRREDDTAERVDAIIAGADLDDAEAIRLATRNLLSISACGAKTRSPERVLPLVRQARLRDSQARAAMRERASKPGDVPSCPDFAAQIRALESTRRRWR
jgi:hypothetical protein